MTKEVLKVNKDKEELQRLKEKTILSSSLSKA